MISINSKKGLFLILGLFCSVLNAEEKYGSICLYAPIKDGQRTFQNQSIISYVFNQIYGVDTSQNIGDILTTTRKRILTICAVDSLLRKMDVLTNMDKEENNSSRLDIFILTFLGDGKYTGEESKNINEMHIRNIENYSLTGRTDTLNMIVDDIMGKYFRYDENQLALNRALGQGSQQHMPHA